MDKQRCLLSIGVLLGMLMAVSPPTIAHFSFLSQGGWETLLSADELGEILTLDFVKSMVQSSQRQSNIMTLDRANLNKPHELVVTTSANLEGQIEIDGEVVTSLDRRTTTLDVAPYLSAAKTTRINVTGTYSPSTASVTLQFEGPGVSMSQQSSGSGRLEYQLNLEVD